MLKHYAFIIMVVFVTALIYMPATAKEDTAQITLRKTAVSKQSTHQYVIKKGDVISGIIRKLPGITQEDIPDNYRIIKELNPNIPNLNKLRAGQTLVLPGKGSEEAKVEAVTADSSDNESYIVKKGDSLIKIIYRQLKETSDTLKTLQRLKSLNPAIKNVNKIYAGQILKMPGRNVSVSIKAPEEVKINPQEELKITADDSQEENVIELKDKLVMSQAARLALIKQIITQMNGSLTATGKYYIPIAKTGQVTIDCTKIPVIELDGQTIFLDLENHSRDSLKRMIGDNWSTFNLVKVDKKDDVIAILRKIFNATKSYSISKKETPLTIGLVPPVEVTVDWLITRVKSKDHPALMHGLRIVLEDNSLLPKAIKNYAQKNGLIITEYSEETGLVGKPEEIYSLPQMAIFPTTSAKDFSAAFLSSLALNPAKDVDIKVFDMAKDGFNLSIKADVLVKNEDKKYIIYSRSMPQQFINVLKEAGNELIFVNDNDPPKVTLEKVLRGLRIPFVSGYFNFSGLDKNAAPFTFGFNGTKIITDKNLYLIDFDIDPGIRGLLQELWSANIARY